MQSFDVAVTEGRLAGLDIDIQKYIAHYQYLPERLKLAKSDALVMHPGPMISRHGNSSEVADSPQSVMSSKWRTACMKNGGACVFAWAWLHEFAANEGE